MISLCTLISVIDFKILVSYAQPRKAIITRNRSNKENSLIGRDLSHNVVQVNNLLEN